MGDTRTAQAAPLAGPARPQVVIIGGGFGGYAAARSLRRAPVDITLIDRTNHHLFQPLLYQVATATLAPSDIMIPIRWGLRRQRNAEVWLGEATAVDTTRRVVILDKGNSQIPYDYLILATGTRHSYFAHPEWEALAPGLKSIEDALDVRNRFLLSFEEAERTPDLDERRSYQTFVVVGGGPTGVELAGMLPDVAISVRRDYRQIDTRATRVVLLEGTDRILSTFPTHLADRAKRDLEHLGVEVRTNARVTRIEADAVYVGDERIPARTVLWAAGNKASSLTRTLDAPLDDAGRVEVSSDLSIPAHPEVFVVGDAAAVRRDNGELVPGIAPAAIQEGTCAGTNILASLAGRRRRVFRYVNKGDLATIGRHRAVANFGFIRVTGYAAWVLWLFVHILYLAGFRNRVSVLVQWAYAYFTYQRGMRLITNYARQWDGTAVVGGRYLDAAGPSGGSRDGERRPSSREAAIRVSG
jgi:NADH:ubiquinone reductase (H+-translocating)